MHCTVARFSMTTVVFLLFAGMQHAATTAAMVQEILAGCADPDPAQHGMTSEEERAASYVHVSSCSGGMAAAAAAACLSMLPGIGPC